MLLYMYVKRDILMSSYGLVTITRPMCYKIPIEGPGRNFFHTKIVLVSCFLDGPVSRGSGYNRGLYQNLHLFLRAEGTT